jgi:hypothetical protein
MLHDPHGWLQYMSQNLGRVSPLYAHLYEQMLHDPQVRELLGAIDPDQPVPVLFFSVVNFLLLDNPRHELACFYPVLQQPPRPAREAYPAFRAFCLEQHEALRALLSGARLQTNEVTRCANLLPAFEVVSRRGARRPLALIEVGCSAGLNLLWDRYRYDYGCSSTGEVSSPVQVRCSVRGPIAPPLPAVLPAVAQRIGIDLAPPDIHCERDIRWLRACVWPEEVARYHLLEAAVALARTALPHVLAGDAIELLPALIADVPQEQTLCLWHSYALHQGPAQVLGRLEALLREASRVRRIFRISLEAHPHRGGWPHLELFIYQGGELRSWEWLANCEFHGQTMEWLAPWV